MKNHPFSINIWNTYRLKVLTGALLLLPEDEDDEFDGALDVNVL